MKGPGMRKELYKDRLGSPPSKSTEYRMHIYPLLWLTDSKHLVRCWSPLTLLPNHTAKKRLCDTDLRSPTYCRELVLMGPGRQMVSNTTRAFASSHKNKHPKQPPRFIFAKKKTHQKCWQLSGYVHSGWVTCQLLSLK